MPSGNPNTVTTLVLTLFALAFAAMWAFALVDLLRRADWEFPRNWQALILGFCGASSSCCSADSAASRTTSW